MALPQWTAERFLPPGRHAADLADVYERLVFDAPHQNDREILFSALSSYLGVARRIIPSGRAWVGGAFIARMETVPQGLDVVLIPDVMTTHLFAAAMCAFRHASTCWADSPRPTDNRVLDTGSKQRNTRPSRREDVTPGNLVGDPLR